MKVPGQSAFMGVPLFANGLNAPLSLPVWVHAKWLFGAPLSYTHPINAAGHTHTNVFLPRSLDLEVVSSVRRRHFVKTSLTVS